MPLGECSALPRTVDTGVARYEAYASHNVRRAVCLSVLEQCSKVPRSELCVKWIPAISAPYNTEIRRFLNTVDFSHKDVTGKQRRNVLFPTHFHP
ncbi:hypothetical protein J6590_070132 [Homalodisca vitripennis]|nr:hypothetical protein J6590_070132 [Homalodisca vitripennis]